MPLALIIGAAGGVGLAVVSSMLDRGIDVIGTVLDEEQEAELRIRHPALAGVIQLNLADADVARDTLVTALRGYGAPVDFVVVCSGISPFGPLETSSLAALRTTIEINAVGCVAIYQACMPALRQSRGRIIFLSSMAGRVGMPFIGHYAGSKFALEGLADVMRMEAYPWGVGVSLIEPGGIRTPLVTDEIAKVRDAITRLTPEERMNYGALYQQFLTRLENGYSNCLDPAHVAQVVLDIIDSDRAPARVEIGADAIRICGTAHDGGADAVDALFRSAYNGALG